MRMSFFGYKNMEKYSTYVSKNVVKKNIMIYC